MNILRALFDRWNADKVVRRLKYTPDELKRMDNKNKTNSRGPL